MLAHTCNASILTCEKIYKKEININNKDGLSAYKEKYKNMHTRRYHIDMNVIQSAVEVFLSSKFMNSGAYL